MNDSDPDRGLYRRDYWDLRVRGTARLTRILGLDLGVGFEDNELDARSMMKALAAKVGDGVTVETVVMTGDAKAGVPRKPVVPVTDSSSSASA